MYSSDLSMPSPSGDFSVRLITTKSPLGLGMESLPTAIGKDRITWPLSTNASCRSGMLIMTKRVRVLDCSAAGVSCAGVAGVGCRWASVAFVCTEAKDCCCCCAAARVPPQMMDISATRVVIALELLFGSVTSRRIVLPLSFTSFTRYGKATHGPSGKLMNLKGLLDD